MRLWFVEKIIVILQNNHSLFNIIFSMKALTCWLKPNAKRSIPSFTLTRRNNCLLCIKVIKTLTYLLFFWFGDLFCKVIRKGFLSNEHVVYVFGLTFGILSLSFVFVTPILQKNKISCIGALFMQICLHKSKFLFKFSIKWHDCGMVTI